MFPRNLRLVSAFHVLIFSVLSLVFFSAELSATPTKPNTPHVKKNKSIDALKNYLPKDKKTDVKRLYTDKWLQPGSFYGQTFIKEDGYLNFYEWLEIPNIAYITAETSVDKQNEFLKTTRGYFDQKSKFIELSIIAPHPRSTDALKLGVVPKYDALFPKPEDIESAEEVTLNENRKAKAIYLKSGEFKIIYSSEQGTKLIGSIEHFRFKDNLIDFFKAMNLTFFEQRINS